MKKQQITIILTDPPDLASATEAATPSAASDSDTKLLQMYIKSKCSGGKKGKNIEHFKETDEGVIHVTAEDKTLILQPYHSLLTNNTMSSRAAVMDIVTTVNKIDSELSVKDKEDLVYLAEVLIPKYATNKTLLWLLGELGRKYCTDRGDAGQLLVALLNKAGLVDNLRSPKELRPPTLEQFKYISKEKCQRASMRSSLIKLRHGLNADTLQSLLQMLCFKMESNPDNYENIYELFRELEQKAEISPGNLGFIDVLGSDEKFANVVHIGENLMCFFS